MAQRTLTNRDERAAKGPARQVPYLVQLLDYEHPLASVRRHELDGLAEVLLVRSEATASFTRAGETATFAIADARMSGKHARITRELGGWMIEDLGSRNGMYVNGTRVPRASLTDGAVIELGRTGLLFRVGDRAEASDMTTDDLDLEPMLSGIQTLSVPFARMLATADKLARSGQSVVLHGETGTGKEVIARAIHASSGRTGAFVAVNCGALPPNLIESELFGYKKGAFSGATEDRPGLIRSAHGGTLFLDEIGDLPAATQASLLRVLQEREVLPIGATRPVAVDVRVLAASHRDLEREVTDGRFREDLLARLAGYVLEIPALRDRLDDLGILIAALLARAGAPSNVRFGPQAGSALVNYKWPRNIRELEQVLITAIALAEDGLIEREYLSRSLQRQSASPETAEDLAPSEVKQRDELRALLATHQGNIAAVARALGVARMQVHRWLEKYALDIEAYRK